MMSDDHNGLRERTRRAVRAEITQAAEQLFLRQGYEATTIEDIATESGMSPRSVYRYFPSKDELLVGRFAGATEALVKALQSRPDTEPAWVSLRAAFEPLVEHADGQHDRASARRVHRAIFSTPMLMGRYLQQLHVAELAARDVLSTRPHVKRFLEEEAGSDAALLAVVGAAFGCLVAAQETWSVRDDTLSFSAALDHAMAAVAPVTGSL
jgi:AcrR family transcriptional regulator